MTLCALVPLELRDREGEDQGRTGTLQTLQRWAAVH